MRAFFVSSTRSLQAKGLYFRYLTKSTDEYLMAFRQHQPPMIETVVHGPDFRATLGPPTFHCSDALALAPLSHFLCSCGSFHPTSPAPRSSKTSRDTQSFAINLFTLLCQLDSFNTAAHTAFNLRLAPLMTTWAKTTNPRIST